MKAWKVFDENGVAIQEEVNAKKDTQDIEGARNLLQSAEKVIITSGKKILEYDPKSADMEEVLKKATGRTGNLRAPALKIGATYYIGFNEELYSNLVK